MNNPGCQRILIIDDNPSIHEDIRKILGSSSPDVAALESLESELFEQPRAKKPAFHFKVDSALQGAEGLECLEAGLAKNEPYAMAFVDMRMPPGWDGIETIQRLWEKDATIQIVLCTAYSDYSWEDIISRLRHSENLVILKKPFDNIELLQLAHALTRKWELSRPVGGLERAATVQHALLSHALDLLPFPLAVQHKQSSSLIYQNPAFQATQETVKSGTKPMPGPAVSVTRPDCDLASLEFEDQGETFILQLGKSVLSATNNSAGRTCLPPQRSC